MGSFSNLFGKFKLLDFMSKEIRLNIDGANTVNTYVGSFFGVVYLFGVLGIAILSLQEYIKNDNPTTYSETFLTSTAPTMNFFKQNFVPYFIGYSGADNAYVSSSQLLDFMSIQVYLAKEDITLNSDQSINTDIITTSSFNVAPCNTLTPNQLSAYGYINKSSSDYNKLMNFGLCIQTNSSFQISGLASDNSHQFLNIQFSPCTSGASCVGLSKLEQLSIFFINPVAVLNATKKLDPLIFVPYSELVYSIVPTIQQNQIFNMKANKIIDFTDTDTFVAAWIVRKAYFDVRERLTTFKVRDHNPATPVIGCSTANIYPGGDGTCAPYYSFVFKPTGTLETVRRKYITFFDTVGTVGGIKEILFAVLVAMYAWYSEKASNEHICRRVFPFIDQYQEEVKKSAQANPTTPTSEVQVSGGSFCRKKKGPKPMMAYALESVKNRMDLVNIIRELNNLKALTLIILSKRQANLVPWLEFSMSYAASQKEASQEIFPYKSLMQEIDAVKEELTKDKSAQNNDGWEFTSPAKNKIEELVQPPFDQLILSYLEKLPCSSKIAHNDSGQFLKNNSGTGILHPAGDNHSKAELLTPSPMPDKLRLKALEANKPGAKDSLDKEPKPTGITPLDYAPRSLDEHGVSREMRPVQAPAPSILLQHEANLPPQVPNEKEQVELQNLQAKEQQLRDIIRSRNNQN